MDDSAITISLQELVLEAMLGNDESLAVLLGHASLLKLIEKESQRAARLYEEDEDEIYQALWDVVRTKLRSLKKPGSIKSWLKAAARNYCFNTKRHRRVERFHFSTIAFSTHDEDSETEPVVGFNLIQTPDQAGERERSCPADEMIGVNAVKKPEPGIDGPRIRFADEVARSSNVQTPEQELLQKEEELLWAERKNRLRKVTGRFPEGIVTLWSAGKAPKEIVHETGIPAATVYRTLKKMERAVYAEFGVNTDAVTPTPKVLKLENNT